jgi:hypothetical protein
LARLKNPLGPALPSSGKPLSWQEARIAAEANPRVISAREALERCALEVYGIPTADPRVMLGQDVYDADYRRLSRAYLNKARAVRDELMGNA